MRRGSRGRGRGRRNRENGHSSCQVQLLNDSRKLPFDLTLCEDIFPPVTPAPDNSFCLLNAALLKRNTELSPSTEEIQTTQNLVTRVQGILETLILIPGGFEPCKVDEVRKVGSFKQGTMLAGHKTADFVVILKTLPTRSAIEALSNRVAEELRQTECVRLTATNRGFDLSNVQATIRVFITTVTKNFLKLDAKIHLELKLLNEHWHAIRHCRWFEENVHNSIIKALIRILADIRQRYSEFLPLKTWMLDLLAHFSVMNSPTLQPLSINVAFRRILSLMSCGMFLPGYAGTATSGHHNLSYEDQDMVTGLAQRLLRILAQGGYKVILGLETNTAADAVNVTTVWGGVVVSPLEKVYEKSDEGEVEIPEEDEDSEEDEDTPMETETV